MSSSCKGDGDRAPSRIDSFIIWTLKVAYPTLGGIPNF